MKYPNPLRTHKNSASKKRDFIAARDAGAVAYKPDISTVPLSKLKMADVEFIGGCWRIQTHADYNLQQIRDKQFIMGPRIDIREKNRFEYYQIAEVPTFNCYGPISAPKFNMVAAHYVTDRGEYWGYGKDIASARAFLGIRLYDEHEDIILAAISKNVNNKQK